MILDLRRICLGGLEELDQIARGVLQQDLLATAAGDKLVAKARSRFLQLRDTGGQILDLELNAVPTSRRGELSIGHCLSGPTHALEWTRLRCRRPGWWGHG